MIDTRKTICRAMAMALLLPLSTFGQYQQFPANDRRINITQPNPDNRVDQELYGNTGGSVRYPYQQSLLPSEFRMLVQQSGATPSELRAQYNKVGPLAPDPRAYIPGYNPAPQWQTMPPPLPVSPGAQQITPSSGPVNTLPSWGGESINWGGKVTVIPESGDYTLPMPSSMRYSAGDAFGAGNPDGKPTYVSPGPKPSTEPATTMPK